MNKTILPAGTYYIGDPCYVISDSSDAEGIEEWHAFLDASGILSDSNPTDGGEFEYKGHMVWMNHTAYGDGSYLDQHGNEYGVDAGLIGTVPVEVADKEKLDRTVKDKYGHLQTFEHNISVEYTDGVFFITDGVKSVIIDTDPKDDDEIYDEY